MQLARGVHTSAARALLLHGRASGTNVHGTAKNIQTYSAAVAAHYSHSPKSATTLHALKCGARPFWAPLGFHPRAHTPSAARIACRSDSLIAATCFTADGAGARALGGRSGGRGRRLAFAFAAGRLGGAASSSQAWFGVRRLGVVDGHQADGEVLGPRALEVPLVDTVLHVLLVVAFFHSRSMSVSPASAARTKARASAGLVVRPRTIA